MWSEPTSSLAICGTISPRKLRRGDGSEQYGYRGDEQPCAVYVHAQRARRFVLQREQIALRADQQREHQPHRRVHRQRAEIVPSFHGDVGVHDACRARIVRACAAVECGHQPREHRVYRHADEYYPKRAESAAPRERVDQQARRHSADECEQRGEKVQRGEKRRYQYSRKARARAYADDAGVGEGVFHYRLQKHARYRHRRAAYHRDKNSREAQVVNGRDEEQREKQHCRQQVGNYNLFLAYHHSSPYSIG